MNVKKKIIASILCISKKKELLHIALRGNGVSLSGGRNFALPHVIMTKKTEEKQTRQ